MCKRYINHQVMQRTKAQKRRGHSYALNYGASLRDSKPLSTLRICHTKERCVHFYIVDMGEPLGSSSHY